MYKLQTNFFGGDATFIENVGVEFSTLDEAVDYLLNNKPPCEFEWNVRLDGKGSSDAWTRYGGKEVSCWKDGKIVTVRRLDQEIFEYLRGNLDIQVENASEGATCGGEVEGSLGVRVKLLLTNPSTGKREVIAIDQSMFG